MVVRQRGMRGLGFAVALILGIAAAEAQSAPDPLRLPDTALEPLAFANLEGWAADDHAKALAAFRASCAPLVRARDERPMAAALVPVCRRALALARVDEARAREFFETNFRPLRISRLGDSQGFVTGYYEPIVEGSRFPTREFTVPLYRRPDDLVAPGERKGESFPNRGPAFRRGQDGKLVPYYDRGEIEDGALDGRHLEICWLKDPFVALTIQIQGSARVRLEDGLIMRVNYAAHNGRPYTPIGRILIERNLVPREEMSLERIRKWMSDNPDQTKELRRNNQGFVFFRIAGLADESEPAGGEGVRLTAGRSIAVDRPLHAYGTPFFIEADLPIDGATAKTPWHRLTIAQDTGSAIVGPARADIYFGAGDDAGRIAGRVRHPARVTMLVPRSLDPVEAGASMPLPRPKPVLVVAKQEKAKGAKLRRARPQRGAEPVVEESHAKPAKPVPATPAVRTPLPHAAPRPPGLAPIDRRLKQKLARGREAIDATIDLHGRTQAEAHAALVRFLRNARADGARLVLVITGKGARGDDFAADRGVLRRQVPLWLRSAELRDVVIGFDWAHAAHGGEGALYVRIRRKRE